MAEISTKPLRLGVIGLGGMGQGHIARICDEIKEVELAAVCDADAAVTAKVAAVRGVPGHVSVDKLIRAGDCAAVLVAAPHPAHPDLVIPCLEAGLDVLVEKPVSERIGTARRMVAAAEKHGRVLAVMLNQRTTPGHAAMMAIARSGELGRITRFALSWPDVRTQAYFNSGGWRATWRGEGGGVLINQAPHILDVLVQCVGLPETVQAWTGTREHAIEVEDFAEARLALPGGGSGFVYASTTEPRIGPFLELVGDAGRALMTDGGVRRWRFPPMGSFLRDSTEVWARCEVEEVPVELPADDAGHAGVIRNFARHLLFGEELRVSARSGLGQVELSNAMLLSGALGREVTLPLDAAEYDAFLAEMRERFDGTKENLNEQRLTDPGTVRTR